MCCLEQAQHMRSILARMRWSRTLLEATLTVAITHWLRVSLYPRNSLMALGRDSMLAAFVGRMADRVCIKQR
jgi:hypothetical protein